MKKPIFSLIIAFIIIIACSSLTTATPAAPTETAAETFKISDPDQPIEVTAGGEFEIVFKSNPTTGYHWELLGELDPNVVEFVSKDYKADKPVLIGSGGVDIWVFKAIRAGETTIALGSYPPSNDAAGPAETLRFTIVVK